MNLCTVLLITFLVIFSFCLKGTMAGKEIHGLLGRSVLLPNPDYEGTPSIFKWFKLTSNKPKVMRCIPLNTGENYTEKCKQLSNGSLIIHKLQQDDAGDYRVSGYASNGNALFQETTITLKVHEPLPQPQLIKDCSNNTVVCEVKSDENQSLKFILHQNNKMRTFQGPKYVNGTWRVTSQPKNLSGKFKCEVVRHQIDKQYAENEINCPGTGSLSKYMIYLLLIGGGVLLIIFVALIVYFVRKKAARRRELEDEGREIQAQLTENTLKHRSLPQPSIQATSNHTDKQQRPLPPPPHSEQQPQGRPPQPRPRPPQQKPPRRMKERS
uniref:T-cell surface antigen CD2 n=1 Tax=Pogona vitticeps TaxID=103695 RepID=A0A6J0V731_9SAUR